MGTFLRIKLYDAGAENVWFQQDEATTHTTPRSLEVVREGFPRRLISLGEYVEFEVPVALSFGDTYKKIRPTSLEKLKERIREEIDDTPPHVTRRVMVN
ncbi:hypothetical protein Trydic_g3407 [Trypoxylus dichotomus]